jgi:hypothetical protein
MSIQRYTFLLSLSIVLIFMSSGLKALAHEDANDADGDSSSSTNFEVNTSDDKSSIRLKIENRLKTTKQIKGQKEIAAAERKSSFEEKLKQIKDEKKRTLAQRLSNQINKINDIRTERYLRSLERLTRILEKMETRVKQMQTSGKNVDTLLTKIESIKTSIESTTSKVEAQQEKTYTVEIQSEATLGADFRKVHDQLKSDLASLNTEIKKIKDDIISLFRELKSASSPTPSPAPTT